MKTSIVTAEQKKNLKALIDWLREQPTQTITLGGYAGTGKTTLIGIFRLLLKKISPKYRVAFCAYTGKASRVLWASLKAAQATFDGDTIGTIHGLIYKAMVDAEGHVNGWQRKEKLQTDLIVVDEASMVTSEIWTDLTEYGIPVLAVGDHGQLPPIGGQFNLMAQPQLKLTTIHRQAQDNPIIQLSILARETGTIPLGNFGPGVKKLSRADPSTGEVVEEMLRGFREDLLILTGYNFTRNRLNQTIRSFKDITEPEPRAGDRVIALKNNWDKGIYNGMTGVVKRLIPMIDQGELRWYEAEIKMDDDFLYTGKILANQFNQPATLNEYKGLKGKALGDLFDFGYALTVHKAQGSQAPKVLLFEERNKHMSDDDWKRWLYTGITRAEEYLTIVGQTN